MNLDLPTISDNAMNSLQEDTKELILEFRYCLTGNFYCYTAAMLIFRPLLIHFAVDLGYKKPKSFNEAINFIDDEIDFKEEYYSLLMKIKERVNDINHNFLVLYYGDEEIINLTWDFIKFMVEDILSSN